MSAACNLAKSHTCKNAAAVAAARSESSSVNYGRYQRPLLLLTNSSYTCFVEGQCVRLGACIHAETHILLQQESASLMDNVHHKQLARRQDRSNSVI